MPVSSLHLRPVSTSSTLAHALKSKDDACIDTRNPTADGCSAFPTKRPTKIACGPPAVKKFRYNVSTFALVEMCFWKEGEGIVYDNNRCAWRRPVGNLGLGL